MKVCNAVHRGKQFLNFSLLKQQLNPFHSAYDPIPIPNNTLVDTVIDGNEYRYLVIDNVVPCGFISITIPQTKNFNGRWWIRQGNETKMLFNFNFGYFCE
jgi:hypothetical protein